MGAALGYGAAYVHYGQVNQAGPSPVGASEETGAAARASRRPGPSGKGLADPSRATLAEAIANLPAPELGKREGVVRGRVRTRQGKPLAGVLIKAKPLYRRGERASTSSDDESLDERLQRTVARTRWEKALATQTRSEDDGTYALTDLAEADYRLSAKLEGCS